MWSTIIRLGETLFDLEDNRSSPNIHHLRFHSLCNLHALFLTWRRFKVVRCCSTLSDSIKIEFHGMHWSYLIHVLLHQSSLIQGSINMILLVLSSLQFCMTLSCDLYLMSLHRVGLWFANASRFDCAYFDSKSTMMLCFIWHDAFMFNTMAIWDLLLTSWIISLRCQIVLEKNTLFFCWLQLELLLIRVFSVVVLMIGWINI